MQLTASLLSAGIATTLICFLADSAGALPDKTTAPGTWTTAAPLPDNRTEISMTSDGERLFLLGGFGAGAGAVAAPHAVYAYSPAKDTWTQLTRLPEGVNHAGLVYFDDKLYVIGGYREATFEPTDSLRIYDLRNGTWRNGPPLPTARGALAVAVHDRRIHAIGGTDAYNKDSGAHEVFDPAQDEWTTAPKLPTPRNHIAAATVGNEIIVLAGRNAETFTLAVNEIYTVKTGEWRKGTDVPTGRSGIAAVEHDGLVYLFGGETDDPASTFDEAERYDPTSDAWEQLPPMPTARHGLGAAVLAGRIHVVSGGPQAGMSFSDAHEVLKP